MFFKSIHPSLLLKLNFQKKTLQRQQNKNVNLFFLKTDLSIKNQPQKKC